MGVGFLVHQRIHEKTPILKNLTIDEVVYLYMAFTDKTVNVVLVIDKEGKQCLVY